MAANRLDAVLLADAGGLLSGIVTGKVSCSSSSIQLKIQLSGFCVFGWFMFGA
jgi:hypothetical protein